MGNNNKSAKTVKVKKNKFKHGAMSVAMSIVFIVLIIGVNIVFSVLSDRYPSMNLDLTASKLNTLSETAVEKAGKVTLPTTIYIMANEEVAKSDGIYGSMIKYSQVANLSEKLREVNQLIDVHYVELDKEPDFVNNYPNESLTTGTVIVESEKRYKLLTIDDLFGATQNSATSDYEYHSKVDGALANALTTVNLDHVPVMAIATGHTEAIPTNDFTYFTSILEKKAFTVKEFNIMTEEIPEDTQVLMLPTPTTDYTEAEITKLRDFLADDTKAESKTIVYTAFYAQGELPLLESFLEEWGVSVGQGYVLETNDAAYYGNQGLILANNTSEMLTGSYPYLLFPYTSPLTINFKTNDSISVSALVTSNDTAAVIVDENSDIGNTSEQVLATLSQKYSTKQGSSVTENVVVIGSSHSIMNNYIGAGIFANRTYWDDLLSALTGADADQMYIEQVALPTYDIAMTQSQVFVIGLIVLTIGIPVVILIAGLVIYLKRRHL